MAHIARFAGLRAAGWEAGYAYVHEAMPRVMLQALADSRGGPDAAEQQAAETGAAVAGGAPGRQAAPAVAEAAAKQHALAAVAAAVQAAPSSEVLGCFLSPRSEGIGGSSNTGADPTIGSTKPDLNGCRSADCSGTYCSLEVAAARYYRVLLAEMRRMPLHAAVAAVMRAGQADGAGATPSGNCMAPTVCAERPKGPCASALGADGPSPDDALACEQRMLLLLLNPPLEHDALPGTCAAAVKALSALLKLRDFPLVAAEVTYLREQLKNMTADIAFPSTGGPVTASQTAEIGGPTSAVECCSGE